MSDEEVLKLTELQMKSAEDRRLSRLLDRRQKGRLTEAGRIELLTLMQAYQSYGRRRRDFTIFEELRAELGYADYLGTLKRYRLEARCDPKLLMMSEYLVDYPFANH